jgi:hypothetical protein
MFSHGNRRHDLQLIFQVLTYLLAVDPQFHTLDRTVKRITGSLESNACSKRLPIRRSTNQHAERIGTRRVAVEGAVGIEQYESAEFAMAPVGLNPDKSRSKQTS